MASPFSSQEDAEHLCSLAAVAAREGHVQCLKRLTREELLKRDECGETAAHHAARGKHIDSLRYLCETVPAIREVPSSIGELPAHISLAARDEEAVDLLLAGPLREVLQMALQRDINGTSLLMAACARGDNQMAGKLLKRFGKSLATLPNAAQMLPIHVTAAQGNLELLKLLYKFDSHMVNARDEFGCTPTTYAAQAGCMSCMRFLVETGHSQIGIVNSRGQSLLHVASLCGHENMTRWLLERMGSEAISWKTAEDATALHCAACPARPFLVHRNFSSKKCRQLLAMKDSRGNTPLHLAAISNHAPTCFLLMEHGADLETVNASGHSPIGIASLRGYHELASRLAAFQYETGKKKGKASRTPSSLSGPVLSPLPRNHASPSPLLHSPHIQPLAPIITQSPPLLTLSPKLSSGYSSGGEENNIVERHRMRFVEDGSTRDIEAQTEEDALSERVKILDDTEFLSAVSEIDLVLSQHSL